MVNVFYIHNRTCMDCGKEFTATVECRTGKPAGCIYWGMIDPRMMSYSWAMPMEPLFWEESKRQEVMSKIPWYKKLFKKIIPWYYYDFEAPTAKPWFERFKLKIKELWMKHEEEMWTCHECTTKLEQEGDNENNEGREELEGNNG